MPDERSKSPQKIEIGQIYGKWTVIGKSPMRQGKSYWDCKCTCENTVSVYGYHLRHGRSGGCKRCSKDPEQVVAGQVYGKLTAISLIGFNDKGNKVWLCRCNCGREREVKHFKLTDHSVKSCAECGKNNRKARMTKHGHCVHGSTAYTRYHKYGVTPEEFAFLLDRQNNACAICDREFTDKRALHLDHCHESGIVRGLLCSFCNHGLGNFRDKEELLVSAASYLHHAVDARCIYKK